MYPVEKSLPALYKDSDSLQETIQNSTNWTLLYDHQL